MAIVSFRLEIIRNSVVILSEVQKESERSREGYQWGSSAHSAGAARRASQKAEVERCLGGCGRAEV